MTPMHASLPARLPARVPAWLIGLVAAILLPACAGCGSRPPARFSLRGKITMGAVPVPAGEILFEPDTANGGSGPGTIALIENGHYETPAGRGHAGGPHILRITAYDGKADMDRMRPYGEVLFHGHQHREDLPKASAVLDLVVPRPADLKAAQ